MTKIEETVIEIIANYSSLPSDALNLELDIKDAGVDSMGVVEILYEIEEFYDIKIPSSDAMNERLAKFRTLKDIALAVQEQLETEGKDLSA